MQNRKGDLFTRTWGSRRPRRLWAGAGNDLPQRRANTARAEQLVRVWGELHVAGVFGVKTRITESL